MTDYDYPSQPRMFSWIAAWAIGLVVLAGVISGALWAFGVFTAAPVGRANAYKQQQSANNRIFAQQQFEQENADIAALAAKVAQTKAAYKASPSAYNQVNLQGVQQECITAVQQYNADARKYLLKDFRAADLPATQPLEQCQ